MNRALLYTALLLAAAAALGCWKERVDPSDEDSSARYDDVAIPIPAPDTRLAHDFGSVLAEGQPLFHEFLLKNPTDRVIKVKRCRAMTPCCSGIESVPSEIPAGGNAVLSVYLKTGLQSGRRGVEFSVETDYRPTRIWTLALSADVLSSREIETLDSSSRSVPVGSPLSLALRITCRRIGERGRDGPIGVNVSPPATAEFIGQAIASTLPGGCQEIVRVVRVTVPPVSKIGHNHSDIRLLWANGDELEYGVAWEIVPILKVHPPAFILTSPFDRDQDITVTVISTKDPFAIRAVEGASLARWKQLSGCKSKRHHLELTVRGGSIPRGAADDILIRTDSAEQPLVSLSIISPRAASED